MRSDEYDFGLTKMIKIHKVIKGKKNHKGRLSRLANAGRDNISGASFIKVSTAVIRVSR